ncbi:baseplate J/gp47 family protein [Paenibacillus sp. SYP-B4298]|uniref:baseplate J/gp47 family protein n=1 Tax=Paenibacillus sp. SYP-B4298 TaxID=2996034 RepID=UPI0022DD8A3C|nr:baseplate J/gp47 family protein [Paenibacillus sp. SYP-B4298]
MYEAYSYDFLLARMLERVPNTVDKREGSIIYDALAPAAAELAQMYTELDLNLALSFADTASGEYLTRRAAEFGVIRSPATKARRRGEFRDSSDAPVSVPLGSRFSVEGTAYVTVEQLGTGAAVLECETAGAIGNQHFGQLLPIDYVAGLARAELADILIPGADEESDNALRERYYSAVNEPAFGGNVADYKQEINAISGVGACKVYPAWAGGGTVKATLIAADWSAPTAALVNQVQTIMDPTVNSGQGLGLAPIGHQVTIAGAQPVTVNMETTLTLAAGMTPGQIQDDVAAVFLAYLLDLRKDWSNQPQLVVRTAQLDARILTIGGIEDVADTKLNGAAANLTLGGDEIPSAGKVTLHV